MKGLILGIYVVQSYKMAGMKNNSVKENFYPGSDYNDNSPQDSSYYGSPHDSSSTYDKPIDDSIFDGPPVDDTKGNIVSAETVSSGEKEDDAVSDVEYLTESSHVDKSVESESPTNVDTGDINPIQISILTIRKQSYFIFSSLILFESTIF